MATLNRIVDLAGRVIDGRISPPLGITVLIYHRVGGGSDSAVDMDIDEFARQLEYLAEHHRVISLGQAVDEIAARQPSAWSSAPADGSMSTERAVVVTFDDGTADFVDNAAPLLERFGVPATLYAATHFIDQQEDFPWGAPPATWSGLSDVSRSGLIAIESHSHTHPLFARIDGATAADELDRSIELIGEHIGTRPRHFAYPKAVPAAPAPEVEVRKRFASAALARNRVNRPDHTDLHRLWRTPIRRSDDLELFARRCQGGVRLEGELRALAAPMRYRRSST